MFFLKTKLWPVVAGFVVASIVMMVFEYTNSFFFPLPQDLNWSDADAVHTFTTSLPWNAYVLVLLGWIVGSFCGGYVTTYLSGESRYSLSFSLGILLTIAGIANVMMIGHPRIFTILSIPQFLIFTHLGHRYFIHSK
jgi:hypothetical protein